MAPKKQHRIAFLDGMRGVAILLVMAYHLLYRWSELVPYGLNYNNPIATYGFVGVEIFFMISGFVILMTLERSHSFLSFMYSRWLRLFPAMLVCSLIIYMTMPLFEHRPNGHSPWYNLLPGLTFLDHKFWAYLTGIDFDSLEGVFWSLYVEFKFYLIAGLLFFYFGKRYLPYLICFCYFLWCTLRFVTHNLAIENPIFDTLFFYTNALSFDFFGWFAAGAFYYKYFQTDKPQHFYIGLFLSFLSSVTYLTNYNTVFFSFVALLTASLFFALSIRITVLQHFLSNRLLLLIGFISYPLYLIHENMMISLIVSFGSESNLLYNFVVIIAVLLGITLLAYLVAKYIEPFIIKNLKSYFSKERRYG